MAKPGVNIVVEVSKFLWLQLAKDVRSVFRVSTLFAVLPFFFTIVMVTKRYLFSSMDMNGMLTSDPLGPTVLPEQIFAANPIFVLLCVPGFAAIVYPLANKCVKLTPLRKMCAGILCASIGLLMAGFVQLAVNETLPVVPAHGKVSLSVLNGENANITVYRAASAIPGQLLGDIRPMSGQSFEQVDYARDLKLSFFYSSGESAIDLVLPNVGDRSAHVLFLQNRQFYNDSSLLVDCTPGHRDDCMLRKSVQGLGYYKLNVLFGDVRKPNGGVISNGTLHLCYWRNGECSSTDADKYQSLNLGQILEDGHTGWLELKPGKWAFAFDVDDNVTKAPAPSFFFENNAQGGIFSMAIWGQIDAIQSIFVQTAPNNAVSIFWLIPQLALGVFGEVLFNVTILEFAYSQAPFSMKAIVQAIYSLMLSISSLIMIILGSVNPFENDVYIYFVAAAVGGVVFIVFSLLSVFWYKYNNYVFDDGGVVVNGHDTETEKL